MPDKLTQIQSTQAVVDTDLFATVQDMATTPVTKGKAMSLIRAWLAKPRVTSTASSTTPTPNADTTDVYILTALAGNATFGAPTGTLSQGQKLIVRIKDNGTARTLTWNAVFRAMGTALPTTTVINKTLYLGFIYNSTDTKWDLVASAQEA